ncbi:GNAT family N-acetyltransferase [Paenibacillus sp. GCM10023248]|uniref:GNAT family N-acetyltransferase n=1 Tax=Bacillales TaxID=1385 RepID=UPI0023795359|nr:MULTISPECIES: GNAT family N-acetyltransferase [Bacillales]MDD9265596.1 GNAT family N-acetyltransferase [Paenibacillus sp. MAHUQ-63]MDR6878834.1 FMN phosphatase YigB (HAD superfamily)/GNAT superfamily N-acetyltransferase [Bacillus sp. 3255]
MKAIDTVIFDLDQTLLDKNKSLINFAFYQFEKFSLSRFIPNRNDFIEKFTELNHLVMPKEHVYEQLIGFFNIEKNLFEELLDDLNNNFHLYCIGFDGLHEMLASLTSQGYKLGIVTNGRDFYQRNKIKALGIADYFSDIVTSGSVHIKKPDHAIFQIALTNLKAISSCTVVVGDSMRADIVPAKELGMFTILKSKDTSSILPDAICDNLKEIPNLIKSLSVNEFIITKVSHLETDKLLRLVEESTSEGFRHLNRLVADYEAGTNKFDRDGEAFFIATIKGDIVGVCGLNQDPHAARKEAGRVRRLYVLPSVRRFGIGRLLMDSVIAEAKNHYQMLVLKTDNPNADVFYQSIGFSVMDDSENDTHFVELI